MQKFTKLQGLVAPMDRENVDTDAIIPKQFLKSIKKTGFGVNLFDEWRYLDHGEPGQDPASRQPNPDFVLNQPRYQGASILLARKNFGCGSSREHAPIAIKASGISCVIAATFARIFYRNAINIGLAIIECPEASERIQEGDEVSVDFDTGVITNLTRKETYLGEPFPPFIQGIIASGGLMNAIRAGKM